MPDVHDAQRSDEYARLIDDVTRVMAARLQDAQLPLHILLSSPFGALNENQEELLGAARAAVDAADAELRQLRKLVDLDRGALQPLRQPVALPELLRPVLAIARARAEHGSVQLQVAVSDRAPRALVDATLTREALTTLVGTAIAAAAPADVVHVTAAEGDSGRLVIDMTHGPLAHASSLEWLLAERLLRAQDARLEERAGSTRVSLPAERPRAGGREGHTPARE